MKRHWLQCIPQEDTFRAHTRNFQIIQDNMTSREDWMYHNGEIDFPYNAAHVFEHSCTQSSHRDMNRHWMKYRSWRIQFPFAILYRLPRILSNEYQLIHMERDCAQKQWLRVCAQLLVFVRCCAAWRNSFVRREFTSQHAKWLGRHNAATSAKSEEGLRGPSWFPALLLTLFAWEGKIKVWVGQFHTQLTEVLPRHNYLSKPFWNLEEFLKLPANTNKRWW